MFDLVIKNGLSLIGGRFENYNIGIDGNRITSISKEKLRGEEEINAEGCLVLPGFLNAHTHSAMTLLRGYAEALPLKEWLEKVWQIEAKLDETSVYWGSMLACVEMLKHGYTCFADMYIHMDSVANAVKKTGIRAILGYGMADRGIPERGDQELEIALKFIDKWEGNERIKTMLTPHAIYTCSADFLRKVNQVAKERGLLKHIHVSETLWEIRESNKNFGMPPISYLNSIGFLDDKTILAHCVWVNEKELDLIAKKNATVVHCPSSNLKLSSGIAKIAEMLERNINVAIGTDGAASNNFLNPFVEIRTATLIQQLRKKFISPYKFIEMASENGYRAYGIEGGKIEVKKIADLVITELKSNHAPFYDFMNSLVFSTLGCEVRDVIIDGKIVVEDRQTIFVDEDKVIDKFHSVVKTLLL